MPKPGPPGLVPPRSEQAGIFQEQQLPFAVTAALPLACARFEIEASEHAVVIAIRVTLISHKIGEIRIERARIPELFRPIFDRWLW